MLAQPSSVAFGLSECVCPRWEAVGTLRSLSQCTAVDCMGNGHLATCHLPQSRRCAHGCAVQRGGDCEHVYQICPRQASVPCNFAIIAILWDKKRMPYQTLAVCCSLTKLPTCVPYNHGQSSPGRGRSWPLDAILTLCVAVHARCVLRCSLLLSPVYG
jgi:hypothetical protein